MAISKRSTRSHGRCGELDSEVTDGEPGWVAKMLGHTTLLMLTTRYYSYIPNLTRRDGTLLAKWLQRRR